MIIEAIRSHPHNFWLILGGLLLALEILGVSSYLLWSGTAALLVGLLTWLVSAWLWEWQGAIFAVLTVGSAWLWWYRLRDGDRTRPASALNQRGQQLIGLHPRLSEPLINGFGRLRVGDSTWRVQASEDLPAGTWVEVYATEGITLRRRTIASLWLSRSHRGGTGETANTPRLHRSGKEKLAWALRLHRLSTDKRRA